MACEQFLLQIEMTGITNFNSGLFLFYALKMNIDQRTLTISVFITNINYLKCFLTGIIP